MVIGRGARAGGGQLHLAAREASREREQAAVLDDHARDRRRSRAVNSASGIASPACSRTSMRVIAHEHALG